MSKFRFSREAAILIAISGGVALAVGNGASTPGECVTCITTGPGAGCVPATPPKAPSAVSECITCVTNKCGAYCATVDSIVAGCGSQ